jgi:hypothetical protein
MPEGTKVDDLYKALRAKGLSKESAARIAQAQTGEALVTGRPPAGGKGGKPAPGGRK